MREDNNDEEEKIDDEEEEKIDNEDIINDKKNISNNPENKNKIKNNSDNLVKIQDSNLEFVNLDEEFIKKPKDAEFDDYCSLCSSNIYYIKYICVICKDCIICENCEPKHEHPKVKCKYIQLSTLKDIYEYISAKNPLFKTNKSGINTAFITDIFKKFELKIECDSCKFAMRTNKKINIPLVLQNLSSSEVDCEKSQIVLFGRNNKDLKIYKVYLKNKLSKSQQVDINIMIESLNICKVYDFTIELYSLVSNKLKSNVLNFKVEVNNDQEDEQLNEFFKAYPKILIEEKYIKKGIKSIMEQTRNQFNPILILKFLKNNKGKIDETILSLVNMNNNQII